MEGIKGKDASLHCELYGTAPFQISWYKDKRPLKESRKFKMVTESSSATLHIMKLDQDDAGLYECRVSNNVGSESCRTTITMKGKYSTASEGIRSKIHFLPLLTISFLHQCSEKPAFVKKLIDQSVRLGQELILTATVRGSDLTVSWIQDKDHILREGDNRKITFENNVVTVVVPKADSSTAGKYTCQLRNDAGVVESVSQVTVLGL